MPVVCMPHRHSFERTDLPSPVFVIDDHDGTISSFSTHRCSDCDLLNYMTPYRDS